MYKGKWRWKGVAIDSPLREEGEPRRRIWGKELYGLSAESLKTHCWE